MNRSLGASLFSLGRKSPTDPVSIAATAAAYALKRHERGGDPLRAAALAQFALPPNATPAMHDMAAAFVMFVLHAEASPPAA